MIDYEAMRHLLLVVCLGLTSTACPPDDVKPPAPTEIKASIDILDAQPILDVTTISDKPAPAIDKASIKKETKELRKGQKRPDGGPKR